MGDTEELANALRDAAREAGLAAAAVDGLRLLSGGASKEMWAFDLVGENGARPRSCSAGNLPDGVFRRKA